MAADGRMWALDPTASNTAGPLNAGTAGPVTLKGPVVEGDLVLVLSMIDTAAANPGDVIQDPVYGLNKDSLGNSYQQAAFVNDATAVQSTRAWIGTVTRPGIPTVTMQALPTPGTTVLQSAAIAIDRLVGPGRLVPWQLDGAAAAVIVIAPGTGADAISSGNIATKLQSGLLIVMVQDNSTSTLVNAGTGFTPGAGGAAIGAQIGVKVAAGPGNLAGTATTPADGASRFGIVAFVISWPLVDGDTDSPAPQQQDEA